MNKPMTSPSRVVHATTLFTAWCSCRILWTFPICSVVMRKQYAENLFKNSLCVLYIGVIAWEVVVVYEFHISPKTKHTRSMWVRCATTVWALLILIHTNRRERSLRQNKEWNSLYTEYLRKWNHTALGSAESFFWWRRRKWGKDIAVVFENALLKETFCYKENEVRWRWRVIKPRRINGQNM